MNLFQTTASSRTLSDNQWREWNQAIFKIFRQIWLITLVVELLLFLTFKPSAELGRSVYFLHFILIPSGLEGLVLLAVRCVFTKHIPSHNRRTVSLYTIILTTAFAGITVCVHTSVSMLPAMLLLPMVLTPLYRDKAMTLLQAFLVILVYVANAFYFTPNSPYILPSTPFSPITDTLVFVGGTWATYILLARVNESVLLNEERSRRDSLTHLYNHESFYEELTCYLDGYDQRGTVFSIIVADIDNFKKVNDTYGHAFGDEVIKQVARLFLLHEKKGGFSARYGGEEFTMIIPDADPVIVAEKIRSAFESYDFETLEGIRHFTLSIGAAVCDKEYTNASALFEQADAALYRAKENGKNQVAV